MININKACFLVMASERGSLVHAFFRSLTVMLLSPTFATTLSSPLPHPITSGRRPIRSIHVKFFLIFVEAFLIDNGDGPNLSISSFVRVKGYLIQIKSWRNQLAGFGCSIP